MESLNPFKDGTPFHPALVHVPIGAAMFVPLLAAILILSIHKGWVSPKAWWIVVIASLVALVGGIMSYNTGEFAKDMVVGVVPDEPVEHHERLAQYFMFFIDGTLVLSLLAAFIKAPKAKAIFRVLTFLVSLGMLGMSAVAGHAGGKLLYLHYAGDAYGPRSEGDTSFCDQAAGKDKDDDKDEDKAGDKAGKGEKGEKDED